MSEKIVERAFVQGTVTFTISCNDLMGVVPAEIADDDRKLEAWLEDKAYKMIDSADSSVEIDNDTRVYLSEKTADEYTNEIISREDWYKLRQESMKNRDEL
ncbi:hypothetical protein G3M81_12535 [Bacillus paralicheniformis]|uniref:hypothetical protein n=1 Tax=Bacillus TaxID=1386 RepID=UPI0013EF25F0|nr:MULTISPECIES: hypothetical protein [Bacillus]MCY8609931.1 hypothetical protein [Bacillus haynesii]MEC0752166.1 hypothetical protein [Bacillus haynesii]QII49515.1 hypothetical protein G3M81_12535 [Bacillus paralicheniformis]